MKQRIDVLVCHPKLGPDGLDLNRLPNLGLVRMRFWGDLNDE